MPAHPDSPYAAARTDAIRETGSREPYTLLLVLTLVVLLARLFAAQYAVFIENDSRSLAAGVATLLRDSGGDIYRYGPQLGYYHLSLWLTRAVGGDVMTVPLVQVTLSVVAGTLLPILGYLAFRTERSREERWLTFFVLASNPLLWISSRYGNSALPSVAIATVGLVILSNRPAKTQEAVALFLLAAGILVRADAVLIVPGAALLLWRNHGALIPAVRRIGGLAVLLALVYTVIFVLDPLTRSLGEDVAGHLSSESPTMFWEYLLWSTSPFLFIVATVGAHELFAHRRWMATVLAAWTLPVFAFYYASVTQPRYFLLTTVPLAVAAAAGMTAVATRAGRWRRLALAAVVAVCSVHLLIGLGHFAPAHRRSLLVESEIETHTGPLWTGALLHKSYLATRLWKASLLHPRFGQGDRSGTGPTSLEVAAGINFDDLASGAYRGQRVVILHDGHFGNALHFYSQAAGVRILSKAKGLLWDKQFEMELGGARVTMLGRYQLEADGTLQLPVNTGDEVWMFARNEANMTIFRERVPPGLILVPGGSRPDRRPVWRFRVVSVDAP